MTASDHTPAPLQNYPILVREYGINCDSGGAGKFRGGCGIVREIEILAEEATISPRISNIINPPYGLAGGLSGRSGSVILNPGTAEEQEISPLAESVVLKRGDVVRMSTPGGGGYGHPFVRQPEQVLQDVLGRIVSPQAALQDYGVVLSPDRKHVEADKTLAYRSRHRKQHKLIHRNRYFDIDEWCAIA